MYKFIEDYRIDEYDKLCSRMLGPKYIHGEKKMTPITFDELLTEYEQVKGVKETIKELSPPNVLRLLFLLSAIGMSTNLKIYMNNTEARKGLEEGLGAYDIGIEQILISFDAIHNFKNKADEGLFLENEVTLNESIVEAKNLINQSEKLSKRFKQVLKNLYKKELISKDTLGYLFQEKIIEAYELRAFMDNDVKEKVLSLYFTENKITNQMLCSLFGDETSKTLKLYKDKKIDQALFFKLVGLSKKQIFKLNEQGLITDELLYGFISNDELLEMYKDDRAVKFLRKISQKDLLGYFFERKITEDDFAGTNFNIYELLKSEVKGIGAGDLIRLFEIIKASEGVTEEIKRRLLPQEDEIIKLYEEALVLDGQHILKLYHLKAISLAGLINIYTGQDIGEENTISKKDIEDIFNADTVYQLYKNGEFTGLIEIFYKMKISDEIKQSISNGIAVKLKSSPDRVDNVIALFEKGILFGKDIKDNNLTEESSWIKAYENKLKNSKEQIQDVLEGLIKVFEQSLIAAETVNILIGDFNLKNELLIICDKGAISSDKFGEITDIKYSKEDFIKMYEDNILKTKIPIIMSYNANILSDEDFEDLYHDGIILEDEIFDLSKKGFLSENKIIRLYVNCMISEDKINELEKLELISVESRKKAEEELQMGSIIQGLKPFFDDIDGIDDIDEISDFPELYIPERKSDDEDEGYRDIMSLNHQDEDKWVEVIDPVEREHLITKFYKAKKMPSNKINMSDKSAFADYEFYYIPEPDGRVTPDSIVVAERYFKDKEAQEVSLVYGNATYLFKFKDLMRIFNKSNNEIEKISKTNCDKSALRLNHGKFWARRFGEKLMQIKGKAELREVYTPEEIRDIRTWEKNIDTGIFNFYIQGR